MTATSAATTVTSFHSHRDQEELRAKEDDAVLMKNVKFDRVSLKALGMDDVQLCDKSQYAPKVKDSGCACCEKKLHFYDTHHCRVCGDIVCGQCSTNRIKSKAQMKSIRTCNKCFSFNLQLFNKRLQEKAESPPALPIRRRSRTDILPPPPVASKSLPARPTVDRAPTKQPPPPTVVDDDSKRTTQSYIVYGIGYGAVAVSLVVMDVSMDMALIVCACLVVFFLGLLRLLS
ncbi:unnamed protein product [Aphanomyces euteiches]|uniref:FYVE-type domain-containing protein n=1 Tax=Aphanomyces euteiches TaxID=100861 RepID=A0A6G0WPU7_9STRA|nr:hypothetical protein Ae201684_012928 [Aphanomyces euteiches]KAH9097622.1 hypothetical protein Ae201684P_001098 [Aphanomyces euteiches]KAH9154024.1 hypothetical protein AeRB84_003823 [Aphanomyces euteiches]